MRRMMVLLAVIVAMVAGCMTSPVTLRHAQTGQTVKCGPYRAFGDFALPSALRESQCIQDFQRQGYERVPN